MRDIAAIAMGVGAIAYVLFFIAYAFRRDEWDRDDWND